MRRVAWLLLLLAGIAAAIWFAYRGVLPGVPLPVRPDEPAAREVPAASVAPSPRSDAVDDAAPRRRSSMDVSLQVLDSAGAPLVGYAVFVDRPGRVPSKRTDDEGRVVWPHLGPGRYRAELYLNPAVAHTFELQPGQGYTGTLQLPEELVVVEGCFTRGGEVARGVIARLPQLPMPQGLLADGTLGGDARELMAEGWVHAAWDTDGTGWLRLIVPAGSWRLEAVGDKLGDRHDRVPALGRWHLDVPRGSARRRFRYELAACELLVAVRDAGGRPVVGAQVALAGRSLLEGYEVTKELETDPRGEAAFGRICPGEFRVRVHGEELLPGEAQVLLAPSDRDRRVDVEVRRARTLALEFVDERGRHVHVRPEQLPALQVAGAALTPRRGGGRLRGLSTVEYGPIAAPTVELRFEDRLVDGAHGFLPFEPPAPRDVSVPENRRPVVVTVRPRAVVDLRACEPSGRESFGATVTVLRDGAPVVDLETRRGQRFLSPLPPGSYRVVIEKGDARREHIVDVARQDLRLRLKR